MRSGWLVYEGERMLRKQTNRKGRGRRKMVVWPVMTLGLGGGFCTAEPSDRELFVLSSPLQRH
jgi:hypothetical protein